MGGRGGGELGKRRRYGKAGGGGTGVCGLLRAKAMTETRSKETRMGEDGRNVFELGMWVG